MSVEDNIRIAERWIEALTKFDVEELRNLRAPGYILEHPGFPGPVGGDEEDDYLQSLAEALPDWHWEVAQVIAQGDFVVRNGVRRGTQIGTMSELGTGSAPAVGKELVLRISNTLQFENGKVVRSYVYYDRLSLLKQLGLVPPGL
jgi:steroid delta-isomerase-like uncharacterized protein